MPSEDYAAASTGALKLKGVDSSSKVGKHKKKRTKRPPSQDRAKEESSTEQSAEQQLSRGSKDQAENEEPSLQDNNLQAAEQDNGPPRGFKTEAELRHEERRRKRLDERLKREGIKTHKEKVEELNRYLSNLSEHHDMYVFRLVALGCACLVRVAGWLMLVSLRMSRIGPG